MTQVELSSRIPKSGSGNGVVIPGSIIDSPVGDNLEGTLPLDGNYFKLTDFPELALVYPNGKLPDAIREGAKVVTGVSGDPFLAPDVIIQGTPYSNHLLQTTGLTPAYLTNLETDGNGTWVTAGESGYASRSTDNGLTWAALPRGLNTGITTASFYALETDGNGTWVVAGSNGYASRSTDNGLTWSALPRGLNTGGNNSINGAGGSFTNLETDGNGTWIVTHSYGYASRSTDNGLTWATLPRGLNSGSIAYVPIGGLATDKNGTWIVLRDDGSISKSNNNGVTWTGSYNSSLTLSKIETDGLGTWVAITVQGSVLTSLNNGSTWTISSTNVISGYIRTLVTNKGLWLAMSTENLFMSEDKGATWILIPQHTPANMSNHRMNCITSKGPDSWYAIGNNSPLYEVKLGAPSTGSQYQLT